MSHVPGSLIIHPPPGETEDKSATDLMPTAGSVPDRSTREAEIKVLRREVDFSLAEFLAAQRSEYLRNPIFDSLYTDLTEFVCRPGKRLRPLLFLLGHRIFQSGLRGRTAPAAPEGLKSIAVSLELLHAFILVHDDIIDRAETRRGMPTIHRIMEGRFSSFTDRRRAGRNLALVMGDILFALAQKCLLQSALPPEVVTRLGTHLLGCMVETGFGEVADIVHSTRDVSKVGVEDIEQMYCLKTTCYTIEGPLAMAAVLAGAERAELEAITRIAKPAGLAFQIQNDLDEFARFEVSDAEVPADILEGKKTLLVRTAFDRLSETDRSLLQLCLSAGTPTEGTVSTTRDLVAKSGAVGVLTSRMDRLFAESQRETCWPGFPTMVRQELSDLLHLIRGWRSVPQGTGGRIKPS